VSGRPLLRLATCGLLLPRATEHRQRQVCRPGWPILAGAVASRSEQTPCSFGAIFAEVRVDIDVSIPRVSRVVGVYRAGKILNAKTARSQMTGGIIWGNRRARQGSANPT
jgi:CO/xanthine dehydrogenase Mo-binding subunit